MTNVTRMTLTSSSCDSTSTHSLSLVSSVTSSVESNITSSSSELDNESTMEENEKYWQNLWQENFQFQYEKGYEVFHAKYMVDQKKEDKVDEVDIQTLENKAKEKQDKKCKNSSTNTFFAYSIFLFLSQQRKTAKKEILVAVDKSWIPLEH